MKRLNIVVRKATLSLYGRSSYHCRTWQHHCSKEWFVGPTGRSRTLSSMAHLNDQSFHYKKRKRKRPILSGKIQLLEALQQQQQVPSQSPPPTRQVPRSPRAIAAHNILYLFNKDHSWRQSIFQALEESENNSQSLTQEYYETLWNDCIASLQQCLESSPELDGAMERLVQSGFGSNITLARTYRQSLHANETLATLDKTLASRQARVAHHLAQVATLQDQLQRQQQELNDLDGANQLSAQKKNEEETATGASLLEEALRRVTSMLMPNDDEAITPAAATATNIKRDKLKTLLHQTERLLQTNQTLASTAQHQMEEVRQQQEHIRQSITLSDHDYLTAHQALEHERNTLCQALVRPLLERHNQLVERFQQLDDKTDLTKPHEWYPYARLDRRAIIYHGGPTNSGKTYQALERLKQAKKGLYLGPLRLLAVEVYETLTAAGVYCSLFTGQEIQRVPFGTHGAATVEMADLTEEYDVVVIDEIQMIADKERGFAWTRALLGSRCKEIHVCGGLEAKDLVERIAAACGDTFELRTYERFTDLHVSKRSLASASDEVGSYKKVQPGDCVVAFSRKDIFAIKREIETLTSYKCCVIYGSLPPLTRTEQARRFNDPDSGYDVLVASDAVGMGLNLNIRRIVFNSMYKQDGFGIVHLDHSMVKQISGRAGRRNSPFPEGEVTCRSPEDMAHLRKCMATPVRPIQSAGLVPTAGHVELFHDTITSYGLGDGVSSLHSILGHFSDMAKLRSDYFLCRQTPMMIVAKQLATLNLPIRDKYTLCMSPVVETSRESLDVLKRFATKLSVGEVPGLPQNLRPKHPSTFDDLSRLCSVYSLLELFLWLQNKFPPVNLMEQQTALSRKERTIELIGEGLALSDRLKLGHSYINRDLMLRGKLKESRRRNGQGKEDEDDVDQWMVDDV